MKKVIILLMIILTGNSLGIFAQQDFTEKKVIVNK